jgi:signal transduction histidine kinase
MSSAARLNSRITRLAVGRHLAHRIVRIRLTLLYGGLFLLSGAALMAIAYALLVNAGFVFTLQNATTRLATAGPLLAHAEGRPSLSGSSPTTHAFAQTMAHWRQVAQCMRQHGVSRFPNPVAAVPTTIDLHRTGEVIDRDGAVLAIPSAIQMGSAVFARASGLCGFVPDAGKLTAQDDRRRTQVRQQLLLQSGIALAGMSLLSLVLGWLMAGRVLQPLEDSFHAQRQFVANASHELRAPLTRLRALSEVALASSGADFASLRRAHERVLASEQDLEQLIDALLALTRGQAGLERRERLDLAPLTSQALAAHESQLTESELEVSATIGPAPTAGDPRLLERLIANLIDNAIRHNTRGGRIEITTATRDRHALLSIANTGWAIPPEEIQRLFEPFQRLDGARTRPNNGHGLGLSIVQAIAGAHHAELTARSRAEGGLTIEISFPRMTSSGEPVLAPRSLRNSGEPRTL